MEGRNVDGLGRGGLGRARVAPAEVGLSFFAGHWSERSGQMVTGHARREEWERGSQLNEERNSLPGSILCYHLSRSGVRPVRRPEPKTACG